LKHSFIMHGDLMRLNNVIPTRRIQEIKTKVLSCTVFFRS
jgi:hypothetical protein